jgi:DNA-binding response OmpR family regulator
MKILVIDDDLVMTDLLSLILQPTASEVFVAHSGADGIKFTREQSPDLITLDTILPDMDGIQVCQAVRKFSSVPILILSGFDAPCTITAALNMGADDYLVKPVLSKKLLARIDQLICRSQQEAVLNKQRISF